MRALGLRAFSDVRCLITSTSEVYGKSQKVPFSEEDDQRDRSPQFRRWSYASAKALDEFLGMAQLAPFKDAGGHCTALQYGFSVRVVVMAWSCPGSYDRHFAVSRSLCMVTATRRVAFCHVTDIVEPREAYWKPPTPGARFFNLGNKIRNQYE